MRLRPFELQDAVLEQAASIGDAECFLKRSVVQSIEFNGPRLGLVGETGSFDFAVRILCDGREGIAAAPLMGKVGIAAMVEQAVFAASNGRRLHEILVKPCGTDLPISTWEARFENTEVISQTIILIEYLTVHWPRYLWTGSLSQKFECFRVRNSGGAAIGAAHSGWGLVLRGQQGTSDGVRDRLFEIEFFQSDNFFDFLRQRLEIEIPADESTFNFPKGSFVALGAEPLGKIVEAFASRKRLCENVDFDPKISILDKMPPGDCDEEGVKSGVAPLVCSGEALHWTTFGSSPKPIGRAQRHRGDFPPRVRPSSLYWHEPHIEWPERVILISELAALTVRDDGTAVGTPTEGVLLEGGRPVVRCKAPGFNMQLSDLFGTRFIGCPLISLAAGRHRLPPLIFN